jgi:O-phospho-L-seryl-tRNASec:L-selenocysteinyl-tRNA synthase
MRERLHATAGANGERLLETPGNPISIGMSLAGLAAEGGGVGGGISFLGSMLFSRCVSGTRVVAPGNRQEVGGIVFDGFGASYDEFPVAYLTAAAALGTTREDVDRFCTQLTKCFKEYRKKVAKANKVEPGMDGSGGVEEGETAGAEGAGTSPALQLGAMSLSSSSTPVHFSQKVDSGVPEGIF